MIKKWIKEIIKECMVENFPPCNITIFDSEKTNTKLKMVGGTYVNSKITISKEFKSNNIEMEGCFIDQGEQESFIKME